MDALFGTSMPLAARFFIAFLVVLVLIALTAWLVRRFGANRLGNSTRGRQPRLAVIDAANVDGRRRLVLIRRDNTEHLLMIGGPTDVVIEPNIVRAAAAASTRDSVRLSMSTETTARMAPAVETSWPPAVAEPAPAASPPRPARVTAMEEPWLPAEPGARARPTAPADSLSGLAAELSSKFGAAEPAPRNEPAPLQPRPTPAAPPLAASDALAAAAPQNDRNLADMAQQLEAALRRAPAVESRPPVTDPLAIKAQPSPRPAARDVKPRSEPKLDIPKFEPKFEPKRETHSEPKLDAKFDVKPEPKFDFRPEAPTAPDKTVYDNLEEEMASLLGRPSDKS
ncbi:MAG TPA: flagellar biosynthetic protein FliO [Pseudolabrys sp.]|nr:flagellar biosynthetic protein FliO [Pseudolabrys sp.]